MQKQLEQAVELRKKGDLAASNQLLLELVQTYPEDAQIQYQCAWSFDVMGEERAAVPYYERAIRLGLTGEDLEGALLGLGSTYRTLAQYEKSAEVFRKGMEQFPGHQALQVFYAMTLYNLQRHEEAMQILLTCLAETSQEQSIQDYAKAIRFYADKLDQVWE
ncbi:tetratricopeptide repeat protein [Paenibacillus sp. JX-17]|uniref:Tetratricopeptide repeat protein n=1 Tax=Paenibacillus lacisoli TaxID=3064525 RepID=A0ABT9CAH0_9BACL|nr:tetratricopeptide repeat protein [Paenibacillus sp. JX-17]MDO7906260.1 tetratricopeptide repeat protein [Paenibacillus sp. JX-17]